VGSFRSAAGALTGGILSGTRDVEDPGEGTGGTSAVVGAMRKLAVGSFRSRRLTRRRVFTCQRAVPETTGPPNLPVPFRAAAPARSIGAVAVPGGEHSTGSRRGIQGE
jgi:hypothetical protein